jgi:hypothetical protein
LRDRAGLFLQAARVECHAFLFRELSEGFDVLCGASREQQRGAVALGAGEVTGQFAVLDRFDVAAMFGIDGDERQVADEFAAAAEVARRGDFGPVRMRAGGFVGGLLDRGGRAVQMASLRLPAHRRH